MFEGDTAAQLSFKSPIRACLTSRSTLPSTAGSSAHGQLICLSFHFKELDLCLLESERLPPKFFIRVNDVDVQSSVWIEGVRKEIQAKTLFVDTDGLEVHADLGGLDHLLLFQVSFQGNLMH